MDAINDEFIYEGWFWAPETPDSQAPGKLVIRSWTLPVLKLDATIVDWPSIRGIAGGFVDMGDPDDIVRDAQPRTIHGRLENGTYLTLFGAQANGPQYYRAKTAIIGGLHEGDALRFHSTRFQLDNDVLWAHLEGGSASTDFGTVSRSDSWFTFTPAAPMTLRDLGKHGLIAARTLARLALQPELQVGVAQVRETEQSGWLAWHGQSTAIARIQAYKGDWLIAPDAISMQHLADWLPVSARLDGLDAAVADQKFPAILELQCLLFATMIEGLHRRLFDEEDVKYAGLTRPNARIVRRAGREAISKAMNDLGFPTSPSDFDNLVAPLNDYSFQQRLQSIKAVVDEAVPDVLADFSDWPSLVKRVRNHLAHWLRNDDQDASPPTDDEKMLVYLSMPWVLRTLLLYRGAKLDGEAMRNGYNQKDEYPMFRANVRALI
ncbi:MAG: hypothetical protein PGN37_01245 [Mycobacterium kyogaense]|uniref:HEPN domain-containing protein n=1 Tax=Mycobacterium kyogaense TaxID=2212479 RepID=UPI002FF7B41C